MGTKLAGRSCALSEFGETSHEFLRLLILKLGIEHGPQWLSRPTRETLSTLEIVSTRFDFVS